MPAGTLFSRVLCVPYLVALALIVWLPGEQAGQVTGIVATFAEWVATTGVPFTTAYTVLEFVANIALFVPFGLLLAWGWPRFRPWQIIALGAASSITIELVQIFLPSRFSTLSDVIANTLGAAGGWLVVAIVARALRQRSTERMPRQGQALRDTVA